MKTRLVASTLVAAILCMVGSRSATADVVFGNLGSTGGNSLSGASSVIGPGDPSESWIAQGFNTGTSTKLSLESITLGLGTLLESATATVSIYSNSFGAPGTSLFTSSSVVIPSGPQATYTFSFSGASLAAGTSYWILPSAGVAWFQAVNVPAGAATPQEQNASGYSYTQSIESDTVDIVPGSWSGASSNRFAVSVQAVPEPSTYALAAVGLGLAGFVRARRRKISA